MEEKYNDSWIGITEIAEYMGVTKATIRNWIKKKNGILRRKSVNHGNSKNLNWMHR